MKKIFVLLVMVSAFMCADFAQATNYYNWSKRQLVNHIYHLQRQNLLYRNRIFAFNRAYNSLNQKYEQNVCTLVVDSYGVVRCKNTNYALYDRFGSKVYYNSFRLNNFYSYNDGYVGVVGHGSKRYNVFLSGYHVNRLKNKYSVRGLKLKTVRY